jgi:hypothetical protein
MPSRGRGVEQRAFHGFTTVLRSPVQFSELERYNSRVALSKPRYDVATLKLTAAERNGLYAARRFIGTGLEEKLGIQIPFDVYFQDPLVAAQFPHLAFDEDCFVPWEPGIADGPTSARFAVVDYDAHTEKITPPARWDKKEDQFIGPDGKPLNRSTRSHCNSTR